jgi:hypothetical protein
LDDCASKAIVWAETCGSVFYKVLWNEQGGRKIGVDEAGVPIYEGEVQVSIVSPFEIFPDRLDAEDFNGVRSVIHAQAVSTEYVREKFGVAVEGKEVKGILAYSELSAGKLPSFAFGKTTASLENGTVLIERYTKPDSLHPFGRLEIVAGDKLL